MRAAFFLIAAVLLSSCVEQGPAMTTSGPQSCETAGGRMGLGGTAQLETCFRPEPDAGKSCTRAGDCSGMCLADTKTCSAESPVFGCFSFMNETGQPQEICVD